MTGRASFADQVRFTEQRRATKAARWEKCFAEIARIRTEYILGMPSLADIAWPMRPGQELAKDWKPVYPDGVTWTPMTPRP